MVITRVCTGVMSWFHAAAEFPMVITRVCTGVMSWFHAAAVHFVARVHKLSTHVARWKSVLQSWVSDIAHLSSSHVFCHHRFVICFARRVVVPVLLSGVCFVAGEMLCRHQR